MKKELNQMNIGDLFIYAARHKLRFHYKGVIDVESLWDLASPALNQVYKILCDEDQMQNQEGLSPNENDAVIKEIAIRKRIVQYIYDVKMQEIKDAEELAAKNQEKQRILEFIAEKQNEALRSMTLEELQAKLEELE